MNRLVVFIGYPGAGKTTLANYILERHEDYVMHDVLSYIEEYKDENGFLVNESDAILAYQDMYKDLIAKNANVILELGTNYPEFNVSQLKDLSLSRNVSVFLCVLDKDTCVKRVTERDRVFGEKQLRRRMARIFPEEHINFLRKYKLDFQSLKMKRDLVDLYKLIKIGHGLE